MQMNGLYPKVKLTFYYSCARECITYHSQRWCHRAAVRWRWRGWWGAASGLFGSESAPSPSGCERSARQLSPRASPPPPCCGPCCPIASLKLGECDQTETPHTIKANFKRIICEICQTHTPFSQAWRSPLSSSKNLGDSGRRGMVESWSNAVKPLKPSSQGHLSCVPSNSLQGQHHAKAGAHSAMQQNAHKH